MKRAPVYRNIARRQSWFGLEPADGLALAATVWALLTFNRSALLWNLVVLAVGFAALRIAKRGKPPGSTTKLLRYAVRHSHYLSAAEPDIQGRSHPFLPHSSRIPHST